MSYSIVEGSASHADEYRELCQRSYQAAYSRPELGITPELFSEEVFASESIKNYFNRLFDVSESHKVWIAVDGASKVIGGVSAERNAQSCELKGFYVDEQLARRGIGKNLYHKVTDFAGDLPITLDLVNYNLPAIAMYKRWGFSIDTERGSKPYSWEGWTQAQLDAYHGIYMIKPAPHQIDSL